METPTVGKPNSFGSLAQLHKGKKFWSITQQMQSNKQTVQKALEVTVDKLGSKEVPIVEGRIYYLAEMPVHKDKFETIDYLAPNAKKETPKVLMSIGKQDFIQIFANGLFSERNSMDKPYFTFNSPADLFWLYVGITPEVLIKKMPHYVGKDVEYDLQVRNAQIILSEIFTTHIGDHKVNILTDFVLIEGVNFNEVDTTDLKTIVSSLQKQLPEHIKAQVNI